MTNTQYYNLKKPGESDNALISDLNDNADALDSALHDMDEGKTDKTVPAAVGNLAALGADGNLTDSGKKAGDFEPSGAVTAHNSASNAHAGLFDAKQDLINGEPVTFVARSAIAGGDTVYVIEETSGDAIVEVAYDAKIYTPTSKYKIGIALADAV